MVMPKFFTGGYWPRTLKSQVGFIRGIDLCCKRFATNTNAPMCIFVGECPTTGGFSANCFG